jgi:hypothetical protein
MEDVQTSDAEFEEEIVEVVSRLEQLGDLVDGTPDEPLLRTLILPLKSRPGSPK